MSIPPNTPDLPGATPPEPWETALERAMTPAPPSASFVDALGDRLLEERARATFVTPDDPDIAPTRRSSRRWSVWAAAACLLVSFAWWSASPRCSWAAVIAAIEQANWVEVTVAPGAGRASSGWFSGARRVVAYRTDEALRIDDHVAGKRILGEAGAIDEQALPDGPLLDAERQLLQMVLSQVDLDESHDGPLEYRVLGESTQRLKSGLWLDVRLSVTKPPLGEISVRLLVDPDTNLPVEARVSEAGAERHGIRFGYPSEGPAWIADPVAAMASLSAKSDTSAKIAALDEQADAPPLVAPEASSEPLALLDRSAKLSEPKTIEPRVVAPVPERPAEPLPPARSVEEMAARTDALLRRRWQAEGVEPVMPASDEEFVRRVHLDLTGRIPTVSAVRRLLAATDDADRNDRRRVLIDSLVDQYDHSSHLAGVWRKFLIPDNAEFVDLGGAPAFERWLTERFRENQPYDQLVADLLTAEGRMTDSGPLLFYAALKLKPEEIARQTSRAFLGVRMDCAQCHDDFFDDRWSQRDFWSFAAFFARISQPNAKMDRVSPVLRVRDSGRGEVVLPDTDEVIPPRFPLQSAPLAVGDDDSRRTRLVDWLTSPENDHFARATVNRVWGTLFGRGIIDPIDDMRPDNDPACPEVLDELATYFVRSGFDLRRLFVTIARTDAYQLSSVSSDDDPERRRLFAQMSVKPFTAEQLYDGIATATRVDLSGMAPMAMAGAPLVDFNRVGDANRRVFLEQFKVTPGAATEYQAGITQALTLMNGGLTAAATDRGTGGLLKSLRAPFLTDPQRVEVLFLATVSRPPSDEESQLVLGSIAEANSATQRDEVFADALWALLNSAEFALNH